MDDADPVAGQAGRRLSEIAPGVLVATAEFAATTSTVVAGPGGGCLVIDPGVSVAELAGLAADLRAAGLTPVAGLATHAHWDHLLWSADLGDVPRYAAPAAVAALAAGRDEAAAELAAGAPGHDLSLFGRVTPLPAGAVIPWGGPEARVIVHDGHAPGHAAVLLPGSGVLVAGDMLSDTEIPLLDLAAPDPLGSYRDGLGLLAAAAPAARWLVPGHGHVTGAAGLRARLDADFRYLDRLAAGRPFADSRAAGGWLRDWHDRQLRQVRGAG